jgi:pyruvate/2-oxoglutarate dehydrogenase complex dihydrolipoamide dehydrogenase (E3) component
LREPNWPSIGGLGHEVTVLEMLSGINDAGNNLQGQSIRIELQRIGVGLNLNTKALEISDKVVIGLFKEEQKLFLADTVVCAAAWRRCGISRRAEISCA